jgi:hypothetical protein
VGATDVEVEKIKKGGREIETKGRSYKDVSEYQYHVTAMEALSLHTFNYYRQ